MESKDLARYRFGVLTISDTRTEQTDVSGREVENTLLSWGAIQIERQLVHDDINEIKAAILDLCTRCDAVFTTGGTGFSPRDVTPEATVSMLERRSDSLSELMRLRGLESTPLSHLCRGVSGVIGMSLVANLPGSPSGAQESMSAIRELLPHILEQLRGEAHD